VVIARGLRAVVRADGFGGGFHASLATGRIG
jgi:hypothetical protein